MKGTDPKVDRDSIRAYQGKLIRAFLGQHADAFRGDVLDYGCGRRPYESLVVKKGARYHPYDRPYFPGSAADERLGRGEPLRRSWDAILSTQMLQYVPDPWRLIDRFAKSLLRRNGRLVLTYATNWDEVESDDLTRTTHAGMTRMLAAAGFETEAHAQLGVIELGDFSFPLGYGVVARVSRRNRLRRVSRRRVRGLVERLPFGEYAVYALRDLEAGARGASRKKSKVPKPRRPATQATARPSRPKRATGGRPVFLAPHNDDETLFGAFTLLRDDPLVIVCLRSFGQEERGAGVTWQTREAETELALRELNVSDWEQWTIPDANPDWDEIEARLRRMDVSRVYAPAVEANGHKQHNALGTVAASVFGDRLIGYLTYTQSGKSVSPNRVSYEGWMIERKLSALACYRSQLEQPAMNAHFLRDQNEYYA